MHPNWDEVISASGEHKTPLTVDVRARQAGWLNSHRPAALPLWHPEAVAGMFAALQLSPRRWGRWGKRDE